MSTVSEVKYKGLLTREVLSCGEFKELREKCSYVGEMDFKGYPDFNHNVTGTTIELSIMEACAGTTRRTRKVLQRGSMADWRNNEFLVADKSDTCIIPNLYVQVVTSNVMDPLYDAAGNVKSPPGKLKDVLNATGIVKAIFPGVEAADGSTGRWRKRTVDYDIEAVDYPVLDLIYCTWSTTIQTPSTAVDGHDGGNKINFYETWQEFVPESNLPYHGEQLDYDAFAPFTSLHIEGKTVFAYYDELSFYYHKGRFSVSIVAGMQRRSRYYQVFAPSHFPQWHEHNPPPNISMPFNIDMNEFMDAVNSGFPNDYTSLLLSFTQGRTFPRQIAPLPRQDAEKIKTFDKETKDRTVHEFAEQIRRRLVALKLKGTTFEAQFTELLNHVLMRHQTALKAQRGKMLAEHKATLSTADAQP